MLLFECSYLLDGKLLHLFVTMEKHVENETDDVSLDTILDVMCELRSQKHQCTFERIYATARQQHRNISTHALKALIDTAVKEKLVEKIVTNNISSYQVLDSAAYSGHKSATSKRLILAKLSDSITATFAAEGNTDSKRSLSIKCIEQKISSEGRIHVSEDFDLSRNIRLVCRQLVTRGVLQQQGARYHLLLDSGHKKLNGSSCGSEVSSDQAGITRGQKHTSVRFCKSANADNKDNSCSSGNDSKLISSNYRVIGEVLTSEVACRNKGVCDAKQKAVVKQKTRTLLRNARGVSLKSSTGLKPGILPGRKNLRHKKYQLRSSAELAVDAVDMPLKRRRKHGLCAGQLDIVGPVHVADTCKDTTAVKDANKTSTFSAEKCKHISDNLCQNTAKAQIRAYKSCRGSGIARKSTRNHTRSHISVDGDVATSVVDCLIPVGRPVVNLYRVESRSVENDGRIIPVDKKQNASTGNDGGKDCDDSNDLSASNRNREIPSHQLTSVSELHGNRMTKVKKTLF